MLYFSKPVDRFVRNLRLLAGYDVRYFATAEPQKGLAPHLHMAIRGTLPRAELRHAAVPLRLNAGVHAPEAAERAGHGGCAAQGARQVHRRAA